MTVFSAIVELTKASWKVLRRHPLLIWFPILSLVATFAAFIVIGPLLPIFEDAPWLALFVLLFTVHVVHVFFSVALTSEALKALRGEAPITIRSGISTACERAPSIASMAAVTAVFGFFLELLGRSRSGMLRFARAVFGTGWTLVTYLAIPVMVQERRDGIASLRRSGDLFRRTWGETALSEVGVRVLTQWLLIALLVLAVVLIHVFGESPLAILLIVTAAAAMIGFIGSLEAIYRAALYVFASEGVVPESFSGQALDEIWRVKPTEPTPPSDPAPPAPTE